MWYKSAQSQKTIDEMRKKFEEAFPNNKPGSLSKFMSMNNFQSGQGAFGTPQKPGIKTQLQTRPTFENALENQNVIPQDETTNSQTPGQISIQPSVEDDSSDINVDESVSLPSPMRTPFTIEGVDPITNKKTNISIDYNRKFWVIQPGKVTSHFGPRNAPTQGASSNHKGIDIAGPEGSDVFAAAPGIVSRTASDSKSGNYVVIDHGNGYQTSYSHLSAFTSSKGQRVKQGDVIGKMGQTGVATGPHLHFMVYKNGTPINPL